MAGFTAGGLISGLDSNSIISQLMAIERQPITRMNTQISALKSQQQAVRDVRTQLMTLRNRAQDFRLNNIFSSFQTSTSDASVATATASSSNPVTGTFDLNVTQLATATAATSSSVLGAVINPAASLSASGITTSIQDGSFSINGTQFTLAAGTQTLNQVLTAINSSAAGVTATYDAVSDKVTIANTAPGNVSVINFGASADTSNFLSVLGVKGSTQSTNGSGSTSVTSSSHLGALSPSVKLNTLNFASGAVTSESFTINGVTISVDPTTDSMSDVIGRINASDAGVTASFDTTTDGVRIVSKTLGSRTVNFGAGGTNNFLKVTHLDDATQTAGKDAQFTVNGGAAQTRNSNEFSDAIAGVTVRLLSVGTSTLSINSDDTAIIESVKKFLDEFNTTTDKLRAATATGGDLKSDSSISTVESYLRSNVFANVSGVSGTFKNLIDIGISTGQDFNSSTTPKLELDEEKFRKALLDDRTNVQDLFANTGKTGIGDLLYDYLDTAVGTTGFLNERSKANGTIDRQVQEVNDRITSMESRLVLRESRLRQQFTQLEQMSAGFQNQASAISRLSTIR